MDTETHVVTGAGPVGTTVALQLAESGARVRLLTRSGSGPDHPAVERLRHDVSRPDGLAALLEGATAVHHCVHASRYEAATWRRELPATEQVVMDAAVDAGAVVVFPESLYAYGVVDGPITEASPRQAGSGKPGVRAELLRAREAHRARTVSVVSSDFLGPHVRTAHAGERLVPRVLAGRTVRVLGSRDQPHSFTYVGDLAAAMVRASRESSLWDSVLHAPTGPPVTQRELVGAVARAAGVRPPRVGVLPLPALRVLGVVSRDVRELVELGYQFDRPFVMSAAASQARLGLAPTPLDEALAATVAWWRAP